jgi:tetratricopeptide (TPR) repeat protein
MTLCNDKNKQGNPCQIRVRDGKKYCHVHRRERFFRAITSISAIGVLLVGILGFIADITGVLSYTGIKSPIIFNPEPTSTVEKYSIQVTPTAQTPTIAPTPLSFPAASGSDSLIIVADFDDRSSEKYSGVDPAQYIYEQLIAEVKKEKLAIRVERLHQTLDENSVDTVGETYNATLVLWGWYDALTINPRLERVNLNTEYGIIDDNVRLSISEPSNLEFQITEAAPEQITYLVLFIIGQNMYENRKFEEALLFFQSSVKVAPVNTEGSFDKSIAHKRIAVAYLELSMREQAIQAFDQVLAQDPENVWALALRGGTYREMNLFTQALDDLNKAIEISPDYLWTYNVRGMTYRQMERYAEALADFAKILEADPENTWAIRETVKVYRQQNKPDEALLFLDEFIDNHPMNINAVFQQGLLNKDLKLYAEALADFHKVLEIEPDHTDAMAEVARVYYDKGDLENSILSLNEVISAKPDSLWAYSLLSEIYYFEGDINKSLLNISQAIKLDPQNTWNISQRGYLYALIGQDDKAYSDFMTAFELGYDNAWLNSNIGEVLLRMNRDQEAVNYLERAIKKEKNYYWPYYQYYLFYAQADRNLALNYLDKAITLLEADRKKMSSDLTYQEKYMDLAMYYLMKGDYERSKSLYTEILESNQKKSIRLYAVHGLNTTYLITPNDPSVVEIRNLLSASLDN